MASLSKNTSFKDFQKFIDEVYGLPNDRNYSVENLLVQLQRFSMRSLKGIRKNNSNKIELNLLISLSWLMAITGRLHLSVDEVLWKRFPNCCSYCGSIPCKCKAEKIKKRIKLNYKDNEKPNTIEEFQNMFANIYPPTNRTLSDAGVHLAEEVGEISEALHNYLGKHEAGQFGEIRHEIADYISCSFGIANSADINIAEALFEMFNENCYVCHKIPCECTFSIIGNFQS